MLMALIDLEVTVRRASRSLGRLLDRDPKAADPKPEYTTQRWAGSRGFANMGTLFDDEEKQWGARDKAGKFKKKHPKGLFAAVVYYPFTSEHVNVQSRLESRYIDAVCFASQGEEQIGVAVGLLVDRLKIRKK